MIYKINIYSNEGLIRLRDGTQVLMVKLAGAERKATRSVIGYLEEQNDCVDTMII
jgi:hypothetical protein